MSSSTKFVPTLLGCVRHVRRGRRRPRRSLTTVDPAHTYPALRSRPQRRHVGTGAARSTRTAGKITLDKEAGTGTVEVTMDMKTIDFGHKA